MPYRDINHKIETQGSFFLAIRPEDRHAETIAAFCEKDINIKCLSVVDYIPLQPVFPSGESYQGVVITSRRAIPSPEDFPEYIKNLPFYVVGDQTAAHLLMIFGITPRYVAETGTGLMDKIVAGGVSRTVPYLYFRGDEVAVDARAVLELVGAKVKEVRMYESRPVTTITHEFKEVLYHPDLKGILFWSRQSARVFRHLVLSHDFMNIFPHLVALCLSEPVLECVSDLPWKDKVIARAPDRISMQEAVTSLIKNKG